jgi:hypothetical protein
MTQSSRLVQGLSSSRLIGVVTHWLFTNDRLVSRILILGGVLIASAIIAPRAAMGGRIYMMLVLLVFGALPGLLLLYKPIVGILLIIPAALYAPININTGTGTRLSAPVVLVTLMVVLWLLDMLVRQKKIFFINSRSFLPFIILFLVACLSFGVGQLPWFIYASQASITAQIGGLSVFFLSMAAFFLAAHHIQDLRWLKYLTFLFLALGGMYIIGRLIPPLSIERYFQRGAHGSLFWLWLVALSTSQALFNTRLKPHWRLVLAALAAATLSVGFFQVRYWASGWVPAMAVVAVMVFLYDWRLGIFATVTAVVLKLVFDPGLLNELLAADEYSINTRWVAWEIVLGDIFSVNPLLGLGPSNYYHYTHLFPILGWYVDFNSHNQYVDLLAQIGILGLLAFFWLAWEIGRLGWRLRAKVPEGFAFAYVNGALAGLVGMLVAGMLGDWVLPFVYNIGLIGLRASLLGWMFLGALVALESIYDNKEERSLNQVRVAS